MTRYEELGRKAEMCVKAGIRCIMHGSRGMADVWQNHAVNLFLIRNELTIEQGAAKV